MDSFRRCSQEQRGKGQEDYPTVSYTATYKPNGGGDPDPTASPSPSASTYPSPSTSTDPEVTPAPSSDAEPTPAPDDGDTDTDTNTDIDQPDVDIPEEYVGGKEIHLGTTNPNNAGLVAIQSKVNPMNYLILGESIPLGTITVPEGMDIDDISIRDSLTPIGAAKITVASSQPQDGRRLPRDDLAADTLPDIGRGNIHHS